MLPAADWSTLPPELLVSIFKYLKARDLTRASTVCIQWFRVFHLPQLWTSYSIRPSVRMQDLTENLEVLKQIIPFIGRYAREVLVYCQTDLTEKDSGPLLWGFLISLLQGLTVYGTSRVTSFSFQRFTFRSDSRADEIYESLIAQEVALFLEAQTCLDYVNINTNYLSIKDAETVVNSLVKSKSSRTVTMLVVNALYAKQCQMVRVGEQLRTLFSSCQKLTQINLNYSYLKAVGVEKLCESLRETLKWLVLQTLDGDQPSSDEAVISSDSWRKACQYCPRLQVELTLACIKGIDLRLFIVQSMPLVEMEIWLLYLNSQIDELAATVSMLLCHVSDHFSDTLRSASVSATPFLTREITPTKESLVHCLNTCNRLKKLTFSPVLMTPALIEEVRSGVREGLVLSPNFITIDRT